MHGARLRMSAPYCRTHPASHYILLQRSPTRAEPITEKLDARVRTDPRSDDHLEQTALGCQQSHRDACTRIARTVLHEHAHARLRTFHNRTHEHANTGLQRRYISTAPAWTRILPSQASPAHRYHSSLIRHERYAQGARHTRARAHKHTSARTHACIWAGPSRRTYALLDSIRLLVQLGGGCDVRSEDAVHDRIIIAGECTI